VDAELAFDLLVEVEGSNNNCGSKGPRVLSCGYVIRSIVMCCNRQYKLEIVLQIHSKYLLVVSFLIIQKKYLGNEISS
jgi:hypothetical protein